MNISNTQNHIKHHPSSSKAHKKRLTQEQVRLLESSFDAGKKLDPERKFRLARELGVPPRQIAIWYQNKRARWKNQSLELDYGALQVKLESALTDKKELQREVDYLRGELKRAQDMAFGFRPAQAHYAQAQVGPPVPVSVSSLSSEDGDGSSSLNDDVDCSGNWANNHGHDHQLAAMQFDEEMYAACFMMGGAKGTSSYGNGTIPNNALNINERDFWL